MAKYHTLTVDCKLHFKRLLEEKPDLNFRGRKVSWNKIQKIVKILSEPTDTINVDKLPMRRGLSTYRIAQENGRILVARRIDESNIGALLRKFPHLPIPPLFDKSFNVAKAVDALFGLRVFNLGSAIAVYKPVESVGEKRKRDVCVFKEPRLFVESLL